MGLVDQPFTWGRLEAGQDWVLLQTCFQHPKMSFLLVERFEGYLPCRYTLRDLI
jgi:hypothetical protein